MEYENPVIEHYRNIFPGYADTLEKIIYPSIEQPDYETKELNKNSTTDVIEKLSAGKSKTLKATVKELLNEIEIRKGLNSGLNTKINDEICKTKTYLHEINEICQRRYDNEDLKFGRRRTQLENRLITLEQEKRQKQKEFWKDSMFLKKYLMGALADYWTVFGRENLFNENDAQT
jgi:hypothetical protein